MGGRSAAARSREEATAKLASLKMPKRVKMGTCPVCETTIYANNKTAWVSIDDKPVRIHKECKA